VRCAGLIEGRRRSESSVPGHRDRLSESSAGLMPLGAGSQQPVSAAAPASLASRLRVPSWRTAGVPWPLGLLRALDD
jgi:hypothetical protein